MVESIFTHLNRMLFSRVNIPAAPAYGLSLSWSDILELVVPIMIFLIDGCCWQGRFRMVKLKSSLRMFYGRYHDLVNRYGISVSQMTTDMFPFDVITIRSFPHSLLITEFVTRVSRRVPHVEQELHHGGHVARSLGFCVMFYRSLFVLFFLAIVLYVLRLKVSDYPFGIFKPFCLIYIS
jgi:hypothetical protein